MSRKRSLSLAMIRKLHKGLSIPAEILIQGSPDEPVDLSAEPRYDYSKFPLQEMLARGYFPDFTGGERQVRVYAEELVRKFMQSTWQGHSYPTCLRARLHQSGSRIMDEYALLAWSVAVVKKARSRKLAASYKEGTLTDAWLHDLAKLSGFEQGPKLAQEFLADSGIVLVVERHFKKTYLDGAAMLDNHTPIVALTLRHDRLDNFWFALMHELIHVRKHLQPSQLFIADNLDDKARSSKQELEADQGARNALIPPQAWEKSAVKSTRSAQDAVALAKTLRIHPAIVAGRVRHEAGNWRLMTSLLGTSGDISKHFSDQIGETIG